MDVFSKRLKLERQRSGLKQTDLAEALHTTGAAISTYENGREPDYDVLVAIASLLGVSTDYLLGISSARRHESDPMTDVISDCAAVLESSRLPAVSADDLQVLFAHLRSYAAGQQTAGELPALVTRQFITGMTDLLQALNSDSAAAVIDAGNALLSTVLSVSGITAAYLSGRKDSSP